MIEQRSSAWHRQRLGMITASEFHNLMKNSKQEVNMTEEEIEAYKTEHPRAKNIPTTKKVEVPFSDATYTYLNRKVMERYIPMSDGTVDEYIEMHDITNAAMRYGTDFESMARDAYAKLMDYEVMEVEFVQVPGFEKIAGASADGIVREEKGGGRQETGLQETDGQDMEGQPGDGRDEGGQICAGALEFLQPYMDEGLLTSLAADPERMQDLPELECFLSLPELKKRYAGEPVLPDFILCADGQTALDTADWARERYQGRKPPLITAVGLDAELAGALRSGDVTMTAFCPWKYEAAAAVDLTLALLSGEMISQDWVEHAGFPFECCLGNRFGSGDLQNDTLLLRPETVTGNNLEKILYLYKEDEPQTDPGF